MAQPSCPVQFQAIAQQLSSKSLDFHRRGGYRSRMSRPKSVPDEVVVVAIAALYLQGGDKSVTFASVSVETGLAPPTLVQRYGSRDAMLDWACHRAWDALDISVVQATSVLDKKGIPAFLKSLTLSAAELFPVATLLGAGRSADLAERAETWRDAVEDAIARKMGSSRTKRDAARMAFALWQGQLLWEQTGGKRFRLKEAMQKLG
jgi:AcrR family transcriptional regulator